MSSRHIILGAGAALFLAVAAPLSAQQPTKEQADSACRSLGKTAEQCKTQTQSGVTDSSGASTLGANVKKPTPDANQPVVVKGDTVKKAGSDSLKQQGADSLKKQGADSLAKPKDSTMSR